MNCIAIKSLGKKYPVVETAVYADGVVTRVHVSMILSPDHVDLDHPEYIEKKYRKQIPALESIGVLHIGETKEQAINVTLSIKGKFNSGKDIATLVQMGKIIATMAEDRLSEQAVIAAIGKDCKPWTDEEDQCANA